MKFSIAVLIVALLAFALTGCGGGKQTQQTKEPAKDSPVGVLKTFTDAKNSKDAETMKQTLSKGTLETISEVAAAHNSTLEDYLKQGTTTPLNKPEMPETRNEKIEGEIATVEIKRSSADTWRKLTFVKEDNRWKMDLNRYMTELYPNMPK